MCRQLRGLVSERWLRVGAAALCPAPPPTSTAAYPWWTGGGPGMAQGTGQALREMCYWLGVGGDT